MNKIAFNLIIFLLLIAMISGCSNPGKVVNKKDKTGASNLIGYVNTDPFYLISIETKVRDYLEYQRNAETILYQPSPQEMLKVRYLSLRSVIRNTGLAQPGNNISSTEALELSKLLAMKQSEDMINELKAGTSYEDVAAKYKIPYSSEPLRVKKGNNKEYDDAIWSAELNTLSGPVVFLDRVLIFQVLEKGKDENGDEWADIKSLDYTFPRNEALRQLQDELAKKWDIRIEDKFYSALDNYFSRKYPEAESDLNIYLRKKGNDNPLADYLMYQLLRIKYSEKPDKQIFDGIVKELEGAISRSSDTNFKPYFYYELGLNYQQANDSESARAQFRKALDEVKTDMIMADQLVITFETINDTEYLEKAKEKAKTLHDLMESERAKKTDQTWSKDTEETIFDQSNTSPDQEAGIGQ